MCKVPYGRNFISGNELPVSGLRVYTIEHFRNIHISRFKNFCCTISDKKQITCSNWIQWKVVQSAVCKPEAMSAYAVQIWEHASNKQIGNKTKL